MIRKDPGFGPAPPLATPFGSKEALFAGFVPLPKGTEAQRQGSHPIGPQTALPPLCPVLKRTGEGDGVGLIASCLPSSLSRTHRP